MIKKCSDLKHLIYLNAKLINILIKSCYFSIIFHFGNKPNGANREYREVECIKKGRTDNSIRPLSFIVLSLIVRFWGVVDEIHEVVELRCDDDLGAAVALLTDF